MLSESWWSQGGRTWQEADREQWETVDLPTAFHHYWKHLLSSTCENRNVLTLSCCILNTADDDNVYGCRLTPLVFDREMPSESHGCFKYPWVYFWFFRGRQILFAGSEMADEINWPAFPPGAFAGDWISCNQQPVAPLTAAAPLPFFLVTNWWWQMSPVRWRRRCLHSVKEGGEQ